MNPMKYLHSRNNIKEESIRGIMRGTKETAWDKYGESTCTVVSQTECHHCTQGWSSLRLDFSLNNIVAGCQQKHE